MFKRAYKALILALIASSPGILRAEISPGAKTPSIVQYSQNLGQGTTMVIFLDQKGDWVPGRNLYSELGSSSHTWLTIYVGSLDVSSGVANFHETFVNLASGCINCALNIGVSTTIATVSTAAFSANVISASSSAPRNVIVYFSSDTNSSTVGLLSTTTLVGSATFYGIDSNGYVVTEQVYFSTVQPSFSTATYSNSISSITDQVSVVGVGNVAWASISSVSVQITSMTADFGLSVKGPTLNVGWGNKIGLADHFISTGDVYKVTEFRADVSTSVLITGSTTYNTIVFPTAPTSNLSIREVWYRMRRLWPR